MFRLPKFKKILQLSTILVPLFTQQVLAEQNTDQQRGYDISARADRTDHGFSDSRVNLKMVLRNPSGKQVTRNLIFSTLEAPNEDIGDKSLIIFESPTDIAGTALLSHSRIVEQDNQWLYLPAIKRVKRIASGNRAGPFVGSEFAFEDFTALELNKYDYKFLREEACETGLTCDVVERIPRYKNSGYSKQIAWIDQSTFLLRKVEFYNQRNEHEKTLSLQDYKSYEGIWRAQTLVMKNHRNQKGTTLIYDTYQFKVGLTDTDFNKGRLNRIR